MCVDASCTLYTCDVAHVPLSFCIFSIHDSFIHSTDLSSRAISIRDDFPLIDFSVSVSICFLSSFFFPGHFCFVHAAIYRRLSAIFNSGQTDQTARRRRATTTAKCLVRTSCCSYDEQPKGKWQQWRRERRACRQRLGCCGRDGSGSGRFRSRRRSVVFVVRWLKRQQSQGAKSQVKERRAWECSSLQSKSANVPGCTLHAYRKSACVDFSKSFFFFVICQLSRIRAFKDIKFMPKIRAWNGIRDKRGQTMPWSTSGYTQTTCSQGGGPC